MVSQLISLGIVRWSLSTPSRGRRASTRSAVVRPGRRPSGTGGEQPVRDGAQRGPGDEEVEHRRAAVTDGRHAADEAGVQSATS